MRNLLHKLSTIYFLGLSLYMVWLIFFIYIISIIFREHPYLLDYLDGPNFSNRIDKMIAIVIWIFFPIALISLIIGKTKTFTENIQEVKPTEEPVKFLQASSLEQLRRFFKGGLFWSVTLFVVFFILSFFVKGNELASFGLAMFDFVVFGGLSSFFFIGLLITQKIASKTK